ncbi:MAG TPA: hypothetical protein PKW75_08615, partial [candidate division Zixibacteria bacterium]|nr:hypothetical protein [candidate division Zixibacteria bacterium]
MRAHTGRHFPLSATLILVILILASAARTAEAETREPVFVPGEMILQLSSAKAAGQLASDFAALDLRPRQLLSRRLNIWLYEYRADGHKDTAAHEEVLARVRRHPAVELGQFNHEVALRSTFPDDSSFGQQWALHNTGQTGGVADADIDAP